MFAIFPGHRAPDRVEHIITDLDGTYVCQDQQELDPLLLEIIPRAPSTSFNTGRTPVGAAKLIEQNPNQIHFLCGGSLCLYPDARSEIPFPLSLDDLDRIKKLAATLSVPECKFVDVSIGDWAPDIGTRSAPIPIASFRVGGSLSEAQEIKLIVEGSLPQIYPVITHDDNNYYVHISDARANKGMAPKILAEKLRISPNDMLAFGDGLNDLPMFEKVFGVMVGDTYPELKEVAKAITSTPDKNGIILALESLNLISAR